MQWMRTDSLRNRGSRRFFGALLAVGTFGLRWRNIASAIGANPAKHFLSTLYTNDAANRCITKVLVALYFFTAGPSNSGRVAVFPGAWNPPTRAHLEIARVARNHIGEVIWVLPRIFPHKSFEGASLEARCRMLEILVKQEPGFPPLYRKGGCTPRLQKRHAEYFGPGADIALVCGRDAAERIAAWDYGSPGFFDDFVRQYKLLVAARAGEYEPAATSQTTNDAVAHGVILGRRIVLGSTPPHCAGEDWRPLVPPAIAGIVETLY